MDDASRARDALNHIDAGCARDEWVRAGMAAKSAGLDFDDFHGWSASAGNYSGENECRTVWKSFKDGAVTPATLFGMAFAQGWKDPSKSRTNKSRPSLPPTQVKQTTHKPVKQAHDTGAYGLRLWGGVKHDDRIVGAHPYALQKGIGWAAGAGRVTASGSLVGQNADCLIVPIRANAVGELQGVQLINADGAKQTFGKVSGGCLVLGNTLDVKIPWFVCEGWASAVSAVFHHHGGNAVAGVAFGKHNLDKAAEILANMFFPDSIIILGERDD